MIINYEKKWIYIGPPKTGSTAISFLLTDGKYNPNKEIFTLKNNNNFFGISDGGQHTPWPPNKINDEYKDYFVFISVRNPFSRIVSLWRHWNSGKNLQETNIKKNIGLDEFLIMIIENKIDNGNGFFTKTITDWVFNYNYFIKQENIKKDLLNLNIHKYDFDIPFINKAMFSNKIKIDWKTVHNQNTIDLTIKWAKKDFENFEYLENIDV